jgi:hypothetical protein
VCPGASASPGSYAALLANVLRQTLVLDLSPNSKTLSLAAILIPKGIGANHGHYYDLRGILLSGGGRVIMSSWND